MGGSGNSVYDAWNALTDPNAFQAICRLHSRRLPRISFFNGEAIRRSRRLNLRTDFEVSRRRRYLRQFEER